MLGKLLKYEFKATARIFLPLYVAILVVSIINGLFFDSELFNIQGISMILLMSLFVALFVITIIVTIQRFNNNLLKDEGYLMFTLPVSSKTLVLSKYIVSLVWALLSGLIAFISFLLIVFIASNSMGINFYEYLQNFVYLFNSMIEYNAITVFLEILLIIFISYSSAIFMIYLSLSIGQLPIFNNHRNIASFVTFLVINLLISFSQNLINVFVGSRLDISFDSNNAITSLLSTGLITNILFNSMILVLLFVSTVSILNKKLNLE